MDVKLEIPDALKTKLKTVPHDPGAYLMKDARGSIIYVGKAKDLKNRVSSYFQAGRHQSLKTNVLVSQIADFDLILTKTEAEALLLERTLIKHHKPHFNILLRDDKEYPWIRVDLQAAWPRFEKVRRRREDGAFYMGPYSNPGSLYIALQTMYRIFPLIRCSPHEFSAAKRPCNYYHIKKCLAPCTLPVPREHYVAMVKDAISFLQGRNAELVKTLKQKMRDAAEEEKYEVAAVYRDQLDAIQAITERQVAVVQELDDGDVIGFYQKDTLTSFHVLLVREGRIIGTDSFTVKSPVQTESEALSEFLMLYYDSRALPPELLLPLDWDGLPDVVEALSGKDQQGGQVSMKVSVPKRGAKVNLIEIACKNAKYALEEAERSVVQAKVEIDVVRSALGLRRPPHRIECIDISNLQGTAIVASDVCFVDGRPAKDRYRHYVIKGLTGTPNDFASIHEVVKRRLLRGSEAGDLPDLLVIDGGKGQLGAALAAAQEVEKSVGHALDMEIVSLAKARVDKEDRNVTTAPQRSLERVFYPDRDEPLPLEPGTPEFRLLTQIRDEAHRFAITHHRKRRDRFAKASSLERIPGIGPTLRKRLLESFGSLEAIKEASLEQLKAVQGMREATAVALHANFRAEEDERAAGI